MITITRIRAFLSRNITLFGPIVFIAAILVLGLLGKDHFSEAVLLFEKTVRNSGTSGFVIYVCIFIIAALSGIFPLSLLAVLGGMAFGLLYGFLLAAIGLFVGAAGTFLLGKYVLRSMVERWLAGRAGMMRLDSEIGEHGWKLVGLLRLSPFAPFSIVSYAFSMTGISLGSFVAGTSGALPSLFAFVYTGSISGAALNALFLGETELNDVQMAVAGLGFIATVAVAFLFVRIARRALVNRSYE